MNNQTRLMDAIYLAVDQYERNGRKESIESVMQDYMRQYIEYKFEEHEFRFPGKVDKYYIKLLNEMIA